MNKYMRMALTCAKSNPIRKLPKLAAILVTVNGDVFVGFNRRKTHPLQYKFGKNEDSIYLHAEMDAIVQATRGPCDIKGASLYVARAKRNGNTGLAKPCTGCQRAIMHFGIANVEWTECQET